MVEISYLQMFLPIYRLSYRMYIKLILVIILGVFRAPIYEVFPFLKTPFNILFAYATISVIFTYATSVIIKIYLKRHKKPTEYKDNFTIGIRRLANIIASLITLLLTLEILGIRLIEIITGLSLVAVAIAVISKEFIQNFLNGLIMMFGKKFKVGDRIQIDQMPAKVKDITFMHTELEDESGNAVYVPNSLFTVKEITNFNVNRTRITDVLAQLPKETKIDSEKIQTDLKTIFEKANINNESIEVYRKAIEKDTITLKILITHKYVKHSHDTIMRDITLDYISKLNSTSTEKNSGGKI